MDISQSALIGLKNYNGMDYKGKTKERWIINLTKTHFSRQMLQISTFKLEKN